MSAAEVVADASLALKWVFDEPFSAQAHALLNQWRADRRRVLAPALFLYEVTNALAKRMQRRQLTLEQAKLLLRFFLETGPVLKQADSIHPRALELMDRFGLPAAYDAHYLALAESEQCECWTADERLWNAVKRELGWVRWIGELAPGGS
ncbi:MAG: type II toxin-antitoxin system VapC family toxin [Candidatus Binataceae bacterium]